MQWLGLTFNLDTLIATWVTMAIVILITVLFHPGTKIGACRLAKYSGIYIGRLRGAISSEFGSSLANGEFLVIYVFLFIFVGNELGLMPTFKGFNITNIRY